MSLDLRQARLESDGVELEIYNLFETVTVVVPEGIEALYVRRRPERPNAFARMLGAHDPNE